jgi:hypothetical protein
MTGLVQGDEKHIYNVLLKAKLVIYVPATHAAYNVRATSGIGRKSARCRIESGELCVKRKHAYDSKLQCVPAASSSWIC